MRNEVGDARKGEGGEEGDGERGHLVEEVLSPTVREDETLTRTDAGQG